LASEAALALRNGALNAAEHISGGVAASPGHDPNSTTVLLAPTLELVAGRELRERAAALEVLKGTPLWKPERQRLAAQVADLTEARNDAIARLVETVLDYLWRLKDEEEAARAAAAAQQKAEARSRAPPIDPPPAKRRKEASSVSVRRCTRTEAELSRRSLGRCRLPLPLPLPAWPANNARCAAPPAFDMQAESWDRNDAASQEAAEKAARRWHMWSVKGDLEAAARGAAKSTWILLNKAVPACHQQTPGGVLAPALEAAAGDAIRELARLRRPKQQAASMAGRMASMAGRAPPTAEAERLAEFCDVAIAQLVATVRARLSDLAAEEQEKERAKRAEQAQRQLSEAKKQRGLPLGPPVKRCKGAIDSQARPSAAPPAAALLLHCCIAAGCPPPLPAAVARCFCCAAAARRCF